MIWSISKLQNGTDLKNGVAIEEAWLVVAAGPGGSAGSVWQAAAG